MSKVLVVDDHEVEAIGRAAAVGLAGHEARHASWADLVDPGGDLEEVDVLIAVVRRELTAWDRYRAVAAAGDLRRFLGPGGRIVAAIPGGWPPHPALALRLSSAGADELVSLVHLRHVTDLGRLIASPVEECRPTGTEMAIAGIGLACDPVAVIAYLQQRAEEHPAIFDAFRGDLNQNRTGLTRRQAHTIRRNVCSIGALVADQGRSTGGPERDTSLARWSRVVDFVNACRGWSAEDDLPFRLD
jgi:hypothetical protein